MCVARCIHIAKLIPMSFPPRRKRYLYQGDFNDKH